ncbi:glycosyltransferase family 4 protein [Saccharospirillum alexandrii]|uniref:glycosyltransferase family 4 protein n=1 Tax=Saccharospirillum alexandrii TaxID=2448477 RepID=UPI0037360E8F
MIAYFVYNLNRYSGAARQALLLAKNVGLPIVIFNHERVGLSVEKISNLVEIVNLPKSRVLSLFVILYFIARKKVKILHLHGFFEHGIFIGTVLRKKIILKTTLLDSDDFDSLLNKRKCKRLILFLLSKVDVNVCQTNPIAEINSKHIDVKKIEVIPNAVRLPERASLQKENSFCFVGLVCDRKQTYESIVYYLNNYSKLPNSILYIIGPTSGLKESQSQYYEKCRSLVIDCRAEEKVIFTGNVDEQDVVSYLSKSKALLFFSKYEGMPNVVLEAMANNCAPVTTGVGGVMQNILEENEYDQLTLSSLSASVSISDIDDIIASKALYFQAKKQFSLEIISNRYYELYKGLLP